MNVWVRSGISDKLSRLLAQQDENELHKPLNELETAALYRELKALERGSRGAGCRRPSSAASDRRLRLRTRCGPG